MKMIQNLSGKHTVKLLCEIGQVRSGSYYRWVRQAAKSAREREDEQLKEAIMESWRGRRQTYGSPRIEKDLRQRGIRTSRKRILRLMKEPGIEGCYNRRKNPLATDSRHGGVIHHSDRGSTYCSEDYRELVDQLEMRSSMSAKGYCYDNAHMESFFGSLKCECQGLDQSLSPQEVRRELFDYIEGFYNTHRIHTALGSVSPRQYAQIAVGASHPSTSGQSPPLARGTPAAGLFTPPSATNYQSPFSMEREQPGGKNTSVPTERQRK